MRVEFQIACDRELNKDKVFSLRNAIAKKEYCKEIM